MAGVDGGGPTSHVETSIPLLNANPTICAGTVLAVAPHPVACLLVLRIAVLLLRIVLIAGQAAVPGDLVREAHFEVARGTGYVWIGIFILLVDLPVLAACS